MRLRIGGVEIPWPRRIEIEVDPAGETVGPLRIEIHGGQLWIRPEGCQASLTISAENRGAGLVIGDREPSVYRIVCPAGGEFAAKRIKVGTPHPTERELPTPDAVTGGQPDDRA
jgi:hypothetical protein